MTWGCVAVVEDLELIIVFYVTILKRCALFDLIVYGGYCCWLCIAKWPRHFTLRNKLCTLVTCNHVVLSFEYLVPLPGKHRLWNLKDLALLESRLTAICLLAVILVLPYLHWGYFLLDSRVGWLALIFHWWLVTWCKFHVSSLSHVISYLLSVTSPLVFIILRLYIHALLQCLVVVLSICGLLRCITWVSCRRTLSLDFLIFTFAVHC